MRRRWRLRPLAERNSLRQRNVQRRHERGDHRVHVQRSGQLCRGSFHLVRAVHVRERWHGVRHDLFDRCPVRGPAVRWQFVWNGVERIALHVGIAMHFDLLRRRILLQRGMRRLVSGVRRGGRPGNVHHRHVGSTARNAGRLRRLWDVPGQLQWIDHGVRIPDRSLRG